MFNLTSTPTRIRTWIAGSEDRCVIRYTMGAELSWKPARSVAQPTMHGSSDKRQSSKTSIHAFKQATDKSISWSDILLQTGQRAEIYQII